MRKSNNTLAVLLRKNCIIKNQKREIKRLQQVIEVATKYAKTLEYLVSTTNPQKPAV